jgi:hypothetical protein
VAEYGLYSLVFCEVTSVEFCTCLLAKYLVNLVIPVVVRLFPYIQNLTSNAIGIKNIGSWGQGKPVILATQEVEIRVIAF